MYLAGAAVARARSLQSQCCTRARVQHWAVEVRRLDDGARGSNNHGRGNNSTTNRNWPCNVNEFLRTSVLRTPRMFDSHESEVLGSRASRFEPHGRQSAGCMPAIDYQSAVSSRPRLSALSLPHTGLLAFPLGTLTSQDLWSCASERK